PGRIRWRHGSHRPAVRVQASGEDPLERAHVDARVNAGFDVRVGVGPGAGVFQGAEFGYYQAAAEAGRARVFGIDGGTGTGQHQATRVAKRSQPGKMRRTRRNTPGQDIRAVVAFDHVPHVFILPVRAVEEL